MHLTPTLTQLRTPPDLPLHLCPHSGLGADEGLPCPCPANIGLQLILHTQQLGCPFLPSAPLWDGGSEEGQGWPQGLTVAPRKAGQLVCVSHMLTCEPSSRAFHGWGLHQETGTEGEGPQQP